MPPRHALASALLPSLLLMLACGGDDGTTSDGKTNVAPGDPFANAQEENINVIGAPPQDGDVGPDGTTEGQVLVGTPDGSADGTEICFSDTLCEVVSTEVDWCEREGGPVDLIYIDGVLVETICYPPAEDPDRPLEEISGSGDIDIAQMANKTTVVFDESTNGEPLEGDITVDGNNVSIYGNGPDNTIIDGDVTLDGNNTRLRGVTITGDLILRKNTVAIVLCRILGNLRLETMSTNNSVVAETDVFGDFTSDSNNNLFVGNDVLGNWEHTGNGNTCDRNASFNDDNDNQLVDDGERDGDLSCR
ncbi:MAG: hypothetical protein OEZ06_10515 [Myxococcales bacterium]|nr:hypothetical protein [Myxococcales bacterium]